MTDPTPHSLHPDDERLSALLDGEGQPEDGGHVEGCAACRDRFARLGAVAAAVGAPVGRPDPDQRAAAIAAALAVAEVDADGRHPPVVASLDERRRRPRLSPWLVSAAAVLLLGLAVPAALRWAGEGGADDSAATGTTAPGAQDSATAEAFAAARDAGDLGEIDTGSDLPAQLGLQPDRSAAAPTTTSAAGGGEQQEPPAAESATASCEGAVRVDDPQLGPLLVSARARFDGEPVEVLGFSAGDDVRVYAVAEGTCELRTVQTAR